MGHKLLITSGGNTICGPNSKLKVKLPDGEYVDIMAKDAGKYAGKSTTFFDNKYLDMEPKKLEARLLLAEEGPHACFRLSRDMLFNVEGATYFSLILNQCRDEAGESIRAFSGLVHEYLETGAARVAALTELLREKGLDRQRIAELTKVDVVRPITVPSWFNGTISPDDWMNFYGLSLMGKDYDAATEFSDFLNDFLDYKLWQKRMMEGDICPRPPVNENKYSAYVTYCGCKQVFGRRGKTISSAHRVRRKPGKISLTGTRDDLDAIKRYLREQFCKHVTEEIEEVAILRVEDVQGSKGKKKRQASSERMRKGVIFITPETEKSIPVATKSLYEICRDVMVLERAVILYAKDYLVENEFGNFGGNSESLYAGRLVEEKIRIVNPPYDKRELGVKAGTVKLLETLVEKRLVELFRKPPATEKIRAFQNLHDAYVLIFPAYPAEFDDLLVSAVELENIRTALAKKDLAKKNISRSEKRKMKKKGKKGLKTQQREIANLREREMELNDKIIMYEESGLYFKLRRTIKKLPTEQILNNDLLICTEIFKIMTAEQMLSAMKLEPTITTIQKIKRWYYPIDEIKEVLAKYGGEILIENNLDIRMLETIFSLKPEIDDLLVDPEKERIRELGRKLRLEPVD